MLRHIAMFRFSPEAPADAARSLEEGLTRIRETVETIAAYTFGPDRGLRDGNNDIAVVADFENEDDFRTYVDHPEHQAFIRDRLSPVISERVSLQFEL
jgi:hypothetical protein